MAEKQTVLVWRSRNYERSNVQASLRNFRATIFHDKRESRGGAINDQRDILAEYQEETGSDGSAESET